MSELPSHDHFAKRFKYLLAQRLGSDVGPVGFGVDFADLDLVRDVLFEVVDASGDLARARTVVFCFIGHDQACLVVLVYGGRVDALSHDFGGTLAWGSECLADFSKDTTHGDEFSDHCA